MSDSEGRFNQLFEKFYPKIYGYFFRRVSNRTDVEDLSMVTLTNFFEVLRKKELEFPESYLWKIAHNQLVNFYSFSSKHKIAVGYDDIENIEHLIDPNIEENRSPYFKMRVESLLQCLKKNLEINDYKLVQASIFDGKNSIELSAEFGLKPDNIRQKLSRTFKKAKEKCKKIWN